MAGNRTNRPAWAQSMEIPDGHTSRGSARTASVRGGGPCPRLARGGRRDRPSELRITHTLIRDLLHRFVLGPHRKHPLPQGGDLAGTLGAGLGGDEELGSARPKVGRHLVHRRLRVAEASPGHLGGLAVHHVGPQRLVAALSGIDGAGEVLRSGPA